MRDVDNHNDQGQVDYIPYEPNNEDLLNKGHFESLEAKNEVALTMAQAFQSKVSNDAALQ
jgi:hypothetical protein